MMTFTVKITEEELYAIRKSVYLMKRAHGNVGYGYANPALADELLDFSIQLNQLNVKIAEIERKDSHAGAVTEGKSGN